jgi:hypothetical protein
MTLLVLATATMAAQQDQMPNATAATKAAMDQAAIERSWAIQAELARIEKNPEAFVDQLIQSWAPYLDSEVYDPWNEIKPIAMAATPWRLYGASLVGDFKTMLLVLRGKVGAGRYINALTQPEPRTWTSAARVAAPDPQALGSGTDSLVFTPIAPCRMVDTRGTGARTGIMNPGAARTFDLTTGGYTKGQGGATSGCTGLPSFSNFGWAVNITATGHSAAGGLQAWGYSGPVPATSIINYFPTAYAIANNGSLTGCYGCVDDVTLMVFGGAAHVIIDVMGYYDYATGFAVGTPVVTSLVGTDVNVPAAGGAYASGAACPAGTVLVGGTAYVYGGLMSVADHEIVSSGTTWREYYRNTTASPLLVRVSSTCMDVL